MLVQRPAGDLETSIGGTLASRRRGAASWLLLAAATTVVALALSATGLPSPTLFAALLVGIAVALLVPERMQAPRPVFTAAQAVVGVTLGAYLQSSSLSAIADSWLPVALVSLATLGLSLGAGVALARWTELDPATAALGSIAGGASGSSEWTTGGATGWSPSCSTCACSSSSC
jgi:membrane AbrB-like protein